MIRPRRLQTRHGERRKLATNPELTPLDFADMVRNSSLSNRELALCLEISERLVERIKALDYLPKDKGLQERIWRVYLNE